MRARARVTADDERLDEPVRRRGQNRARPSEPPLTQTIMALQRAAGNMAVAQVLQRDGALPAPAPAKSTDLDEHAMAIVKAAQASTPATEERAVNAVRAILDTYYPDKKDMVKDVKWVASEPGLKTTIRGTSKTVRGIIKVGQNFIDDTNEKFFARRVLQVGHELEHIQQHRDGMAGDATANEREFLAFFHEATATPMPGTGHINRATKLALMDEAIRNYNALSEAKQKQYADQYKQLLAERDRHK